MANSHLPGIDSNTVVWGKLQLAQSFSPALPSVPSPPNNPTIHPHLRTGQPGSNHPRRRSRRRPP